MNQGKLYIIATPIGNLDDITCRAIKTLKEKIDLVYCEDTRRTGKLLSHYGIALSTESLHAHSSEKKILHAIEILEQGKSIGYMTDSGTPSLSDPGSRLVSEARKRGIEVIPLPGASALTTIVSVSGFSEKNVLFGGFLSKKQGRRKRELEKFKEFEGIIVIFESPYRIKHLLKDIAEIFPENEIFIGREMTKMFEEFIQGKAREIFVNIDKIKEKGEFTLAILNNL